VAAAYRGGENLKNQSSKYLLAVAGEIKVGHRSGATVLNRCHIISASSFFLCTYINNHVGKAAWKSKFLFFFHFRDTRVGLKLYSVCVYSRISELLPNRCTSLKSLPKVPRYKYLLPSTRPMRASHRPL
jgi:hypothetical protein